jgi:PadR family transcriptional regulator, regulatory protein PadR
LGALSRSGSDWRHGYDLSRETKLKSGTLYPLLIRMTEANWLETKWADAEDPWRPRRHMYRLSSTGRKTIRDLCKTQPKVAASLGKIYAG